MAMEQSIWVILTAVFAASTAGLAVVLVVINRGPRNTPRPDGRETYVEYETPDYLGYRDFRLDGLPAIPHCAPLLLLSDTDPLRWAPCRSQIFRPDADGSAFTPGLPR